MMCLAIIECSVSVMVMPTSPAYKTHKLCNRSIHKGNIFPSRFYGLFIRIKIMKLRFFTLVHRYSGHVEYGILLDMDFHALLTFPFLAFNNVCKPWERFRNHFLHKLSVRYQKLRQTCNRKLILVQLFVGLLTFRERKSLRFFFRLTQLDIVFSRTIHDQQLCWPARFRQIFHVSWQYCLDFQFLFLQP